MDGDSVCRCSGSCEGDIRFVGRCCGCEFVDPVRDRGTFIQVQRAAFSVMAAPIALVWLVGFVCVWECNGAGSGACLAVSPAAKERKLCCRFNALSLLHTSKPWRLCSNLLPPFSIPHHSTVLTCGVHIQGNSDGRPFGARSCTWLGVAAAAISACQTLLVFDSRGEARRRAVLDVPGLALTR